MAIDVKGEFNSLRTNYPELLRGDEVIDGTGIAKGATPESTYYSVINYFLIIAGVVAVLSLIYGGILYIASAGETEKAEQGKKTITGAIIGIIIIVLSYSSYHYILGAIG